MDKKCPEGKVINPKTGRCIKKENLVKMMDPAGHVAKECPEGKVRNPKTGRCIKKENLAKMMKLRE
jgi:phage FluMu protein Com